MKLPAPNLLSFSGKSTNTGPPKRSDERKSPIDINILPGWKSNRKPKVEMRVPETESCGQSQSQDHHAVSSWTQPFQDPGNNLIQNRQSSTFDISRILIQPDQIILKFPHRPLQIENPYQDFAPHHAKGGESLQWRLPKPPLPLTTG